MPLEHREIRLTEDELREAVLNFGQITLGLLPTGDLLTLALPEEGTIAPGLTLAMRLTADRTRPVVEIQLGPETVLELMLRYCLDMGIPLPREGLKTIQINAGSLSLVIDRPATMFVRR